MNCSFVASIYMYRPITMLFQLYTLAQTIDWPIFCKFFMSFSILFGIYCSLFRDALLQTVLYSWFYKYNSFRVNKCCKKCARCY